MKIAIINGSMPHYDHGLGRVLSVITNTLAELGMESDEINLGFTQIPYFDGMRAQVTDDIIMRLRASAGVIFACTAQLYAPSAILQTFLEFLECNDYRDTLLEKHCFLAMVSKAGGERSALEYLARSLSSFGGFDSGRIGLQEIHARSIQDGPEASPGSVRDIIEKAAENFYRAGRQNRKYISPTDGLPVAASPAPRAYVAPHLARTNDQYAPVNTHRHVQQIQEPLMPNTQAQQVQAQRQQYQQQQVQAQHLQQQVQAPQYQQTQSHVAGYQAPADIPPAQSQTAAGPLTKDVSQKLNLDTFTERQEQDIKELTALFSQKNVPAHTNETAYPQRTQLNIPQYQQSAQYQPPINQPPISQQQYRQPSGYKRQTAPPQPNVRTVKQMTQNLPHYYQPQMASGLTAVIQFLISGAEPFEGYLTIIDSECEYSEGHAENPEITIITDSSVWNDVLSGKHTAQKAFMIGALRVRGNFVLLTKFDTLFKL